VVTAKLSIPKVPFPHKAFYFFDSLSHNIGPEHLGYYMRKRRSVHNYKHEIVEWKAIENILDIVLYAPSGINIQPVNWLIVHDPEEVRKITSLAIDWMREFTESGRDHSLKPIMFSLTSAYAKGSDPICRGAPHLAITYGTGVLVYTDCVIALSWFEIVAPSFDVGSCWAGFLKVTATTYKPLMEELSLPVGHVVQHAMMFGYPEYNVHNIPGRNAPKISWK